MELLKFRSTWIAFLVITGSFAMCFYTANAATTTTNSKVCETEACKTIASSILQKMNRTANPCDNFYDYVCGNFSKNAEIPPWETQIDEFFRVTDLVFDQLKKSIETQITDEDPEALQKLRTFYQTCMDEEQVEKTSIKEFLKILKKLGDWPVLLGKSYSDTDFDWKETINKIIKTGYSGNYFVNMRIESDLKNNSKNLIFLDQPSFIIPQEYLTQGVEDEVVKVYFKFMVDVAEILGADREQAKLELEESLKFEIQLANISLPSSSPLRALENSYFPMNISELQSKYPFMKWRDYLNDKLKPHYRLTKDDVVIVNAPSFFQSLGDLLARTPNRVLSNYLMWRVTYDSFDLLNKKVQDAYNEFNSFISGNNNTLPRWQDCIGATSGSMYIAMSALYVRKNFDKDSKTAVTEMVTLLRQSFKTILSEVDWMDKSTKNTALQKLEKLIPLVAYFDEILDDDKINDYYKDLKLCPNSYLKTVLSYNRFYKAKLIKKLGVPNTRGDWTKDSYASYIVTGFYDPSLNIIQLPAGILQGDFYSKGYPNYVNYAAIGSIASHEMSHALDGQGRKFDTVGNLADWWKSTTEEEYVKRAQCIIDQYSSYVDPQVGLKIDGELTKDENIADNAAVHAAYLAYVASEDKNGVELSLPGFEDLTSRQLFWIAYSNIWCVRYQDELLESIIASDPHPPNQFRVTGPLSNSPYFSKDFKCAAGSPMNPNKKCSIW